MAEVANPFPTAPVITADETRLISEMKGKIGAMLNSKRHSDEYLLRFLKARQMDVTKACEMFTSSMAWRRENHIDEILKTFPLSPYFETVQKYWPSIYLGQTTQGNGLFYEHLGAVEPKFLMKVIPMTVLIQYHIYVLEVQERDRRRQIKQRGYSLPFISIQDCEGLGMKHAYTPGLDFLRAVTKIDEANYPEMVLQIYFINTPSVFSVLYKLVAPFIEKQTLDKLRMSKEELIGMIPPASLPINFGGNATLNLNRAGEIRDVELFPEGKSHTVASSSKFELAHRLSKTGTTFYIHFNTADKDIGFGLYFKGTSGKISELIPNKRYDSHITSVSLSWVINEPGEYITSWDNTFSTWTSKQLFYCLILQTPDQQVEIMSKYAASDPALLNANGVLLPKIPKQ